MITYPLITENSLFDAVILCDGDFPRHNIARAILAKSNYLCCCDNAGKHAIEYGFMPDAIVGDCDTMSSEFYEKHKDIIYHQDEQDDNDQTKATRFCINKGFRHIAYLGATGKREDHTLANISLMARYMKDFGIEPVMITDTGYFIPARGHNFFATFERQQISIFNVSCGMLGGKGFKWQVYTYKSIWQGTLNEAEGNQIELDGDGEYLVFLSYEKKLK